MDYVIDDMTPAQSDAVARLWHAGWIDGHADIVPKELCKLRTLESFQTRTQGLVHSTRVAYSKGEVLGFVMIQGDEIYQMYVGPNARGTGVAQALMHDGEEQIKAAGHALAWLSCALGNERAARFYDKSGWVNARIETVALETLGAPFHLDVWRFEKTLR